MTSSVFFPVDGIGRLCEELSTDTLQPGRPKQGAHPAAICLFSNSFSGINKTFQVPVGL